VTVLKLPKVLYRNVGHFTVKMRRVLWILLLLVVCATSVTAQIRFEVVIDPPSLTLAPEETAEFTLTIRHDSTRDETFEIYSPDVVWDIRTGVPLVVPPEGLSTILYVRPLHLNPGLYGIPINVRLAQSNEIKRTALQIEVSSQEQPDLNYLPAIRGEASTTTPVDPRQPVEINVRLENQNRLELPRVVVKVRSRLINKDYDTNLLPLQRKTVSFLADLDPKTAPQSDSIEITLFAFDGNGQSFQFDIPPLEYEVQEYGTIDEEQDIRSQFLKTSTIITLENMGNTERSTVYKLQGGFFKNWFTSSIPDSNPSDNVYAWDVELKVGESKTIVVTTNYWPIFVVFILIVVLCLGYVLVRSPIVVRKSLMVVSQKEGGISELKIIIRLQNRSRQRVSNIRVIDTIPRIAELLKDFPVGTLAPTKTLRHDRKGTIAKWEIDGLDPGEECIITYKIRSTLSILGGVSLPGAVAKFVTAHGRQPTTKSNVATI